MAPTTKPLKASHLAVLRFLIRHHQMEGCSPTYREIREGLNIAQGQVQSAIGRLEAAGCISKPVLSRGKAAGGRILTVTPRGLQQAEQG